MPLHRQFSFPSRFWLLFATLLVGASLSACSDSGSGPALSDFKMGAAAPMAERRMVAADRVAAQKARNPYLALQHYFRIELPEEVIRERFEETVDLCGQEDFHGCTLIDASLNEDDYYVNASIQLRIQTAGLDPLINTASEGGEISSQSSRAEDLSDAVMDVDERLEMLRSYRERLRGLEESAAGDIESLIKVSSELARVQSDIEQLQGNRDNLQKRLDLDLVNINLYSDNEDDFLTPVAQAFDRFLYHLASGTSSIVTTIAWTLPWLIALSVLALVLRWIWRRRRRGAPRIKSS